MLLRRKMLEILCRARVSPLSRLREGIDEHYVGGYVSELEADLYLVFERIVECLQEPESEGHGKKEEEDKQFVTFVAEEYVLPLLIGPFALGDELHGGVACVLLLYGLC